MFGKSASSVYAIAEIKQPILDSTKICASEEPNALGKGPVQFMPLRKSSGKCHFSLSVFARVTEVRHMHVDNSMIILDFLEKHFPIIVTKKIME